MQVKLYVISRASLILFEIALWLCMGSIETNHLMCPHPPLGDKMSAYVYIPYQIKMHARCKRTPELMPQR